MQSRITNISIHFIPPALSYSFSRSQKTLLGHGLKFIPPPSFGIRDRNKVKLGLEDFRRRIFQRFYFAGYDSGEQPSLRLKSRRSSPMSPDDFYDLRRRYKMMVDMNIFPPTQRKEWQLFNNLVEDLFKTIPARPTRPYDWRSLSSLRERQDIVIKPADKNLGMAVMSKDWYIRETTAHLSDVNTYQPISDYLSADFFNLVQPIAKVLVSHFTSASTEEKLKQKKDAAMQYIMQYQKSSLRYPQFYIIPKLHKPVISSRPIASVHSWITTPLSKWLDRILQPVLKSLSTVLQDSSDLLRRLDSLVIPFDGTDLFLVTADVTALYPSIRPHHACEFLSRTLDNFGFSKPLSQACVAALDLILKNNIVEFMGKQYRQISGFAMGTAVAPSAANIFMHVLETDFLSHADIDGTFIIWVRYIDDIFAIAKGSKQSIENKLNSWNTRFKESHNIEIISVVDKRVDFLDLSISISSTGKITTICHQKLLNKYLYIPPSSFHPVHNLRGFITGELIRYVRNCSTLSDFQAIRTRFYHRLRDRGYLPKHILSQFAKIDYSDRHLFLANHSKPKQFDDDAQLPLIVPYHPDLDTKSIRDAMKSLDEVCSHKVNVRSMLTFYRSRNLREILIRAKL